MDSTSGITLVITPERIRLILGRKGNVSQASTEEAEAFLTLYRDQLETYLGHQLKTFVLAKMSSGIIEV